MVDGFGLGKLEEVVGSAAGHSVEMEDMYAGMLRRLEKLTREVEKSNLRVLKQIIICSCYIVGKSEPAPEVQICRIGIGPQLFWGLSEVGIVLYSILERHSVQDEETITIIMQKLVWKCSVCVL
ncbi:hypothetical protein GUJ93_ZPchr0007g4802 [Zizania palustris]|uniref:Uncharacterized protein n=1 Tax=Zizania palustris TaxID=103762 RepID=A0A8J5VZ86_ZIZPA|nr:hypothetical protein GUJ93_ZPchr0007g4802 [Zizania palustris]